MSSLSSDSSGLMAGAALFALSTFTAMKTFRSHFEVSTMQNEVAILQSELDRIKDLRAVERKGRITAQQRSRELKLQEQEENGYRYHAIGHIESPFPDRRGTPRQPLLVPSARSRIRFNKKLVQHDHFKELEQFSHVWVLFVFHNNTNADSGKNVAKIKPPRLGGQKVGCLSTRSPHRPNNIGLSVCEVRGVGADYIELGGSDMVDGTPVIDGESDR